MSTSIYTGLLCYFMFTHFSFAQSDTIVMSLEPPENGLSAPIGPLVLDLSFGHLELDRDRPDWIMHPESQTGILFMPLAKPIDDVIQDIKPSIISEKGAADLLTKYISGQHCHGVIFNFMEMGQGADGKEKQINFLLLIGDEQMTYWLYATYPISKHAVCGPLYGGVFQSIFWDDDNRQPLFPGLPVHVDMENSQLRTLESYGPDYMKLESIDEDTSTTIIELHRMVNPLNENALLLNAEKLDALFDHYYLEDKIVYFDDREEVLISDQKTHFEGIIKCTRTQRTVFFTGLSDSKTTLIGKFNHIYFAEE